MTFAERIARIQGIAEHTEGLQRTRCSHLRRAERVAQFVNNGHRARSACSVRDNVRITVVHAGKEAENALSREGRQALRSPCFAFEAGPAGRRVQKRKSCF